MTDGFADVPLDLEIEPARPIVFPVSRLVADPEHLSPHEEERISGRQYTPLLQSPDAGTPFGLWSHVPCPSIANGESLCAG